MTPSDGASIASKTLLGLIQAIPADQTAVIAPEQNIRITYGGAAQAGPGRGGSAGGGRRQSRRPRRHGAAQRPAEHRDVPGGVDGRHGGAAQPGYKEDEFRFYLEDTNAKVLLLPPDGLDEARRAAGNVPILTVDMDAAGTVSLSRLSAGRKPVASPGFGRRRAHPAHQRQHRPAEARAAEPRQPVDLGRQRRPQLRAVVERRVAVRDAALPRARARGLDAGHAGDRRHGRRADEVQPAVVLATSRRNTAPPGTRRCRPSTSCCSRA